MQHKTLTAKIIVLLLVLLIPVGCGRSVEDLKATHVPPAVTAAVATIRATLTAAPTTLTAAPATQEVVLLSFHGRYVTATGAGGGWLLTQDPVLSDCGWFTLHHLDNGRVALMTCHGRYVTAPQTGATRSDLRLWQETELDDCGQFTLHDLGRDGIAIETCTAKLLTAGDGGWPGELAWAVAAETLDIRDWERFKILQPYMPPQSTLVDFDNCTRVTRRGGQMGAAYDPNSDDRLVESIEEKDGRVCIAKLEYDIAGWGSFWIQLQGADLSPYHQLVFDIKASSQENIPERIKIELKRANGQEISILRTSGITTDWQTTSVNLSEFEGSLSSFTDVEELVFTFEANGSRKTGAIYMDNIALRRGRGNP